MARGSSKPPRRRTNGKEEARAKKKGCGYCRWKVEQVDYKNYMNLRTLVSEKGKLRSRRVSGLCRRHQNQAGTAVKRAREIALLPYVGS